MNLAEWNAEHPGSVLRSRAAELAAELTGLRALVENFVRQAEARYLELLRELRREFPAADGDDYFVLFLDRAGLPSANALENLKLWETARSHRAVPTRANRPGTFDAVLQFCQDLQCPQRREGVDGRHGM